MIQPAKAHRSIKEDAEGATEEGQDESRLRATKYILEGEPKEDMLGWNRPRIRFSLD